MTDRLKSGLVLNYPYLWRWQHERGPDNAEKDHPVCLAIALWHETQKLTHLVILPISGTPPFKDRRVLEIPALEIRRSGLSIFKQAWLTIDEYNYDIAERSHHFDPSQIPRGAFSPRFMEAIRQAIRPMLAEGLGRIDRTL